MQGHRAHPRKRHYSTALQAGVEFVLSVEEEVTATARASVKKNLAEGGGGHFEASFS